MRALFLFLALGFGAVWISCGGSGTDNLFPGAGGVEGASGNVTGGSGQTGSSTGAAGASGPTGAGGAVGAGGKGSGGATGQGGNATASGGAAGMPAKGGGAGMAGSATAGMGGGAGSTVVDAGPDALPDAGTGPTIRCGTTTCDPDTHFCCLADPRVCIPNNTDGCDRSHDRLHCDDATDCAQGQRCCAVEGQMGNPNDSMCRDVCPGSSAGRTVQILCDGHDAQCPDNDPNCSVGQNPLLATYSYCH